MIVLVINCGSSSVKYQVIEQDTGSVKTSGLIERVGVDLTYEAALAKVLEDANQFAIAAVGHRVVHGGERFTDATLINSEVIASIYECIRFAPLHNPANLAGIKAAQAVLPNVPHVAVFDTAFHSRMPAHAYSYAIDHQLAASEGIRRYGFHGTSHAYVAQQAASYLEQPLNELRLISLHLGNGASACAIEFGHSVDTSMGMTPLEGLVMGTRAGDIDAGAVVSLINSGKYTAAEVDRILNKESGLKGVSGISQDLREVENAAAEGDERARLAIQLFVYRARKYIGAYAAAMGGLDAVILTGGIGENSSSMRQRILQRFDFLGLKLDEQRNIDARVSASMPVAKVCRDISKVKALAIKTNEELMIARQTAQVVNRHEDKQTPEGIPIAVSARHIHLDAATFKTLFGADATLTPLKDLSQPGQYACNERLTLVGPRNRIENVRILGPLRTKNQIEISRTDEFFLGIDAPVRDSGRTEGSAPITLEGPKGSVSLSEGLICARRHIHMHPDDARRFGVKDNDEVEVAITGGPRDLVFGDVLIRVHPSYRLEMHIDTDEANAAELSNNTDGALVYTGINDASAEIRSRQTDISG
ncbi:MAG: acetate/propionate family kinase [Hahellaceae bacterium]|nr:acetate/propionate family kinase [Hahellaceae bacterium]MCP5210293.1 acetate/propionate family kinase [Hahellaceae bacterium]